MISLCTYSAIWLLHGWCHVKLLPSRLTFYVHRPCTSLQCHFMQNHIHRAHVCLAVTCHLHFWQNDGDLSLRYPRSLYTERERKTDRQTDRQANRQTGRQADRQTNRQNDRQGYQDSKLLYSVIIEIKYVAEHIPHHSIQQHILHI